MKFLWSKTGISVIALVALFVFGGMMFSGVLGSTTLGLTLFSNAALSNGLVAHHSFDGEYEEGNVAFGVQGSTTIDYTSASDIMYDFASDGDMLYMIGGVDDLSADCWNGNDCWGIRAHYIHDGTNVWATTSDPSSFNDTGYALALAEDALYIGGQRSNCTTGLACWRYEELSLSDGNQNWTVDSDPSTGNDGLRALVVSGDFIYGAGFEDDNSADCTAGGDCWRIESRNRADGSLQWEVNVDPSATNEEVVDLATDGENLFILGENDTDATNCTSGGSCWRIESRKLSDGTLNWAVNSDMSTGDDDPNAIIHHEGRIYITGSGSATTVGCDTGGSCVYIESRNTGDGSLNWATSTDPDNGSDSGQSITTDGVDLFIGGGQGLGSGCTIATCWYFESRSLSDGSFNWSTTSTHANTNNTVAGVSVIDDYLYFGGVVGGDLCGSGCWLVEKRAKSDGALYTNATSSEYTVAYGGTVHVPGNIGQGLEFDGVNDYISTEDITALSGATNFSIAAWVKPESFAFYQGVFSRHNNATARINMGMGNASSGSDDVRIAVRNTGNGLAYTTSDILSLDEWGHWLMVFDGGGATDADRMKFYFNGEEVSLTYQQSFPTITNGLSSSVRIGHNESEDAYFPGEIDDVRIYDRSLSASEAMRLYQLGATTKINQTLRTNSELEDGLIGHWSFDNSTFNEGSVLDLSGNDNHGYVQATRTVVARRLSDSNVNSDEYLHQVSGPQIVMLEPSAYLVQNGYAFWIGADQSLSVSSTTDGADVTWTATTTVDSQTDVVKYAVWYDRWTDDNTDNLIHIATIDSGTDTIWYTQFDTSDGSITTPVNIINFGSGISLTNENFVSITRAEDGTIYATVPDADGHITSRCSSNCTVSTNWTFMTDPYSGDGVDYPMLMPLKDTNNVVLIYHDVGDTDIRYNVWSATSSSWWGNADIVANVEDETTITRGLDFSANYQKSTGDIYLIYADDVNDFSTADHDIDLWRFDPSALTWSELTNVITNDTGGITGTKISFESDRSDILYAVYARRGTIGTASSEDIHYRISEDGGSTWSAQKDFNGSPTDDIAGLFVSGPPLGDGAFITATKYDTGSNIDELWGYRIGVGDYVDEKGISGRIGQGFNIDGDNDRIFIPDSASFDSLDTTDNMTYAAWLYYQDNGDGFVQLFTKGGYNSLYSLYMSRGASAPADLCVYVAGTDTCPTAAENVIEENIWYHVGFTYDQNFVRMYIDGEQVAQAAQTNSIGQSIDDVILGSGIETGASGDYLGGSMDDVRVYDRALSPSEMKRLYELGATTKLGVTLDTNPDLDDGLVIHYPFDGHSIDLSAAAAEIINQGTSSLVYGDWTDHDTTVVPGVMGQAIEFDGVDDYIHSGSQPAIDDITTKTIATWIQLDTLVPGLFMEIAKKEQTCASGTGWYFFLDDTERVNYSQCSTGTNGRWEASHVIELGEWYHVAVTFDNSSIANDAIIYINGEEGETSEDTTPTASYGSDAAASLLIGADDADDYWDGKMDDFRVYNRILSPDEIRRLYQLGQ